MERHVDASHAPRNAAPLHLVPRPLGDRDINLIVHKVDHGPGEEVPDRVYCEQEQAGGAALNGG